MSRLVTIYGGSGFVGRYIARRMAKAGWRVKVAVRRPNEALFVQTYGVVGQVEPVLCNIRDDASVRAAMHGADAVVNCVGILNNLGRNRFDAVQHDGAERVARIAGVQGVKRLVHLSAIGADKNSESEYARTKALGEEAVMTYFPGAVILRPSVVFGTEDHFFNRFANMTNYSLVLPLVGGNTLFQPVYVDDVAAAAEVALTENVTPGIFELGGPEVDTLKGLVHFMLRVIERRRLVLNLPFWVGSVMGFGFDMMQAVTGGLIPNRILTRDQVRMLKYDNVVSENARGLTDLGISPTPYESVVPEYLWRFRPSGEFAAIKDSAKKLRNT
ncbi:MAG TPA: complex I NDUFA9 subunit family protein [Rhodobacteraceae bacterium]|nr:complex I NDUFA9 subunit family protein [Paracoccaceae bacterium]